MTARRSERYLKVMLKHGGRKAGIRSVSRVCASLLSFFVMTDGAARWSPNVVMTKRARRRQNVKSLYFAWDQVSDFGASAFSRCETWRYKASFVPVRSGAERTFGMTRGVECGGVDVVDDGGGDVGTRGWDVTSGCFGGTPCHLLRYDGV